jgi:uncharacterized membrane protein YkgB
MSATLESHVETRQRTLATSTERIAERTESAGIHITRYGLAIVMIWIGAMKFTAYEAASIQPLVANSPLMSWIYELISVRGFSALLGVAEVSVGVLIALRPLSAKLSAIGSLATVPMFLGTLSFILSTPGWEPSIGFPALSVVPGQFLLKDLVLLGAAVFTAGEAIRAVGASRTQAK